MPGCPCVGLGSRIRDLEHGGSAETEIDLGFLAQDWAGGQFIQVIQTGVPGFRQIGPHNLAAGTYNITVYEYQTPTGTIVRQVEVGIIVNRVTGMITMFKSARVPAFSGRIVINYART
jgi:hypothetical protein